MTKRGSDFKRNPRDFYVTPPAAVLPLLPHLPRQGATFDEPCGGNGALVDALEAHGHMCVGVSDIDPQRDDIEQCDVFDITSTHADMFITNPPWDRAVLHPLISHLSDIAPTYLLFDADWMHTRQAAEHMDRLRSVISVGRISWMGNGISGFDNCAWYLFDRPTRLKTTLFYGRT